jgi:hypothetical protein
MSRVRLLQEYRSERAGTVMEVPAGEAQRLVDTGIALPEITPKQPTEAEDGTPITANLVALKGAIKAFKQAVGPIDWREIEIPYMKEHLGEFILPMLPDILPHVNEEELAGAQTDGPECWYDHISDVLLPRLAERFEALVSDADAEPAKRDKLADAFQAFIADQHAKLFPSPENVAEMAVVANPDAKAEEATSTGEAATSGDSESGLRNAAETVKTADEVKPSEEPTAPSKPKPVSRMNHAELVALAESLNIKVPDGASNNDIKKLLPLE